MIVKELRDALLDAGASQDKADAAAEAVISLEHAATKTDLAELKSALVMWFAGVMIAQGLGVVVATVTLVKLLP